jgi:hypothetical protein
VVVGTYCKIGGCYRIRICCKEGVDSSERMAAGGEEVRWLHLKRIYAQPVRIKVAFLTSMRVTRKKKMKR